MIKSPLIAIAALTIGVFGLLTDAQQSTMYTYNGNSNYPAANVAFENNKQSSHQQHSEPPPPQHSLIKQQSDQVMPGHKTESKPGETTTQKKPKQVAHHGSHTANQNPTEGYLAELVQKQLASAANSNGMIPDPSVVMPGGPPGGLLPYAGGDMAGADMNSRYVHPSQLHNLYGQGMLGAGGMGGQPSMWGNAGGYGASSDPSGNSMQSPYYLPQMYQGQASPYNMGSSLGMAGSGLGGGLGSGLGGNMGSGLSGGMGAGAGMGRGMGGGGGGGGGMGGRMDGGLSSGMPGGQNMGSANMPSGLGGQMPGSMASMGGMGTGSGTGSANGFMSLQPLLRPPMTQPSSGQPSGVPSYGQMPSASSSGGKWGDAGGKWGDAGGKWGDAGGKWGDAGGKWAYPPPSRQLGGGMQMTMPQPQQQQSAGSLFGSRHQMPALGLGPESTSSYIRGPPPPSESMFIGNAGQVSNYRDAAAMDQAEQQRQQIGSGYGGPYAHLSQTYGGAMMGEETGPLGGYAASYFPPDQGGFWKK